MTNLTLCRNVDFKICIRCDAAVMKYNTLPIIIIPVIIDERITRGPTRIFNERNNAKTTMFYTWPHSSGPSPTNVWNLIFSPSPFLFCPDIYSVFLIQTPLGHIIIIYQCSWQNHCFAVRQRRWRLTKRGVLAKSLYKSLWQSAATDGGKFYFNLWWPPATQDRARNNFNLSVFDFDVYEQLITSARDITRL